MNKLLLVVCVVLVLGGGYYLLNNQNKTSTPEPIITDSAMPIVGSSGVAETLVLEENVEREFALDSFEFGFDQKTLTVKKGDTVKLTLTNSGKMPHDWIVDEFTGAKTKQIKNGETDTITFVADTVGEFEYYCSVGQHRKNGMVGKLIVE